MDITVEKGLVLSDLVVAYAEEGEIDERIVKVRPGAAEFIRADIPVLVLIPNVRDQLKVERFKFSEIIGVGAEHLIQISDLFGFLVEASRI